jgi:hypothetical protein
MSWERGNGRWKRRRSRIIQEFDDEHPDPTGHWDRVVEAVRAAWPRGEDHRREFTVDGITYRRGEPEQIEQDLLRCSLSAASPRNRC